MEMDMITSPKSGLNTQLTPMVTAPEQVSALMNLETAIMRLSSIPPARPGISRREQLGILVEQALAAYREYMAGCQISTTIPNQ